MIKLIIGLTVPVEDEIKFIAYSLVCKEDKILNKIERSKKNVNSFKLTFEGMENVIYYFYGLGKISDNDLTPNINFENFSKN